jgi:hypothetical protein
MTWFSVRKPFWVELPAENATFFEKMIPIGTKIKTFLCEYSMSSYYYFYSESQHCLKDENVH